MSVTSTNKETKLFIKELVGSIQKIPKSLLIY